MKILDRYIARSFLVGYAIAFCVLIGLRIIIDLFINLDEFAEHADLGTLAVLRNVLVFYGLNTTLYFRDIAGMITVVAAAFSLGKMIHANELVAMMASGISLKRVVVPILLLSLLSSGLLVIDQEFLIPAVADKLVRRADYMPGQESVDVWFITDDNGSLICSQSFDVKTSALLKPTIILRRRTSKPGIWEVTGKISADSALYNNRTRKWDLINGYFLDAYSLQGPVPVASYDTGGLTGKDISVRHSSAYKSLLSSHQLAVLASQAAKIKDVAQIYSQKHFRITDPIINLAMLMVSLPVLVCRDPKGRKSAVLISFALTGLCFVAAFVCKMFAAEVVFDRVMPEMWAWLPVFIFVPIAFIELDSMKT